MRCGSGVVKVVMIEGVRVRVRTRVRVSKCGND